MIQNNQTMGRAPYHPISNQWKLKTGVNMEKLSEYILQKAMEAGVCAPGVVEITAAYGKDDLLKLYVKRIDYCLEHNLPSNEDLVRLGGNLLAGYGIWVDENTSLKSPEFTVLLGASKMNIDIDGYTTSQIFVKHSSAAEIDVSEHAFVVIDCFNNAILKVRAYGDSKVLINVYGQAKVTHEAIGNAYIKVIHKNKANY
jgi:hypothetical protein